RLPGLLVHPGSACGPGGLVQVTPFGEDRLQALRIECAQNSRGTGGAVGARAVAGAENTQVAAAYHTVYEIAVGRRAFLRAAAATLQRLFGLDRGAIAGVDRGIGYRHVEGLALVARRYHDRAVEVACRQLAVHPYGHPVTAQQSGHGVDPIRCTIAYIVRVQLVVGGRL